MCIVHVFCVGSRTKLARESPSRAGFRENVITGTSDKTSRGKMWEGGQSHASKSAPKSPRGADNGRQKHCPVKGCDSQG